jgi:hypothetical protein
MKVVYVAGSYTADHAYQVKLNIQRAEALGMKVAKMGAVPLTPHCNTAHWEGLQSPQWFIDATKELLKRCDAMIVVPKGHDTSVGTQGEIAHCQENNVPWWYGDEAGLVRFQAWLRVNDN